MKVIDFTRGVETGYDLASVRADGVQAWPFLREFYYFCYHRRSAGGPPGKAINWRAEARRLLNLGYGARNWAGRYYSVFLSSTGSRRQLDGKSVNAYFEWILREIGKSQSLLVEFPKGRIHVPQRLIGGENIVSSDPFVLVAALPWPRRRHKMENTEILDEINRRYDLDVDYRSAVSRFFRLAAAYSRAFAFWRPTVLFVTCYYNLLNQAAIYAAHGRGITVVELQHGRISEEHSGYRVFCPLDRAAFPDWLLCYGDYLLPMFGAGNHFISQDRVRAIGSGYMERIAHSGRAPEAVLSAMAEYKKTVVVTSQWSTEDELIRFLREAAAMDDSILYVFIPRPGERGPVAASLPPNISIFEGLDFYHAAKFCDFHSTVCSTCALEAPALGTPNILIDIRGWAKQYYGDVLVDQDVTRMVGTPGELIRTVLSWQALPRECVIESHAGFYKPDHVRNVRDALADILPVIRRSS